ncbi:Signal transduction histidine kinase (plasmid) [Natrarchaeobaculum sulfurireducens]|uniref:histidine kinase n=2 Tax=Natrarchaeobaculum sulfurireducens TaxID=2044521 RepID=A0A346PK41_9EURY|nr:hybrid sensor histidine kinase/response regulator [Natrarchaeobaculum sulfurireducens]AXR79886.1 Signal transduction histidine kinase [Natrarchaeobaculum sulfurireducens]
MLLVEDQHDQARFVERLLHEQQSAVDGQAARSPIEVTKMDHVDSLGAALESLEERTPDVILLDLMLPDTRGIATVERVSKYAPDVPIVVLTGQDETDVGVDAVQHGAQEYLSKGDLTGETLLRTVRYAIERSRYQRKLIDRNHRLAALNQIVRQDIRNDLSMIIGLGDQLRHGVDPNNEDAVEMLLDAAQHAVDLTDTAATVIDVISADDVEREPCDLYVVLETEVSRLRRERDVDVTLERRDTGDGPVIVSASPMLGSVFKHLLANAVDHSDRSTPAVTVIVETTPEEVTVEIKDDGIGIPDAQKQVLTDPNARFDDRSGMGVGLYLVTTLLESFDGRLEIDDNHPRGARVIVSLDHGAHPRD